MQSNNCLRHLVKAWYPKWVKSLANILDRYQLETDKQRRISREFQDYAYRLAVELGDEAHKAIYMRLAKNTDRALLEEARIFVKGAVHAKSRGRLFMWKLHQLKEAKKAKETAA